MSSKDFKKRIEDLKTAYAAFLVVKFEKMYDQEEVKDTVAYQDFSSKLDRQIHRREGREDMTFSESTLPLETQFLIAMVSLVEASEPKADSVGLRSYINQPLN